MVIWGVKILDSGNYDTDCAGSVLTGIGGLLGAACLVLGGIAITDTVKLNTMEERIAIYEEENADIEEQIKIIVESYQDYEEGIFDKVDLDKLNSDNLLLLTSIYPELKTNTLIQTQIQVHVDNANEIKKLKTQALDCKIWRWWLCFV